MNVVAFLRPRYQNTLVALIVLVFTSFYSIISLLRHFNFRSYALDMGLFNQAIYHYAHFQWAESTIRHLPHMFGDHLEATLVLLAPFYWIFGSYTLLIFQIIAVIAGGIGIGLLIRHQTKDFYLGIGGTIMYYASFGVISALLYDFHPDVLGIAFLPWILLAWRKENILWHYLLLVLMVLTKETFSLLSFFWGISIMTFDKKKRLHGFAIAAVSAAYLWAALSYVIPYFNNGRPYLHWYYENLGNNAATAALALLRRPWLALQLLFNNSVKLFTWFLFLLSGGILAFFYLPYAVLLIPVLAQKFFTTYVPLWQYNLHYSIALTMISSIIAPLVLQRFQKPLRYAFMALLIGMNLAIGYVLYAGREIFLFTPQYYVNQNRSAIIEALRLIPPSAPVSAQTHFVPHLANRSKIYLFPDISDSDYVMLYEIKCCAVNEFASLADFHKALAAVAADPKFELIYQKQGLLLYRRRSHTL